MNTESLFREAFPTFSTYSLRLITGMSVRPRQYFSILFIKSLSGMLDTFRKTARNLEVRFRSSVISWAVSQITAISSDSKSFIADSVPCSIYVASVFVSESISIKSKS